MKAVTRRWFGVGLMVLVWLGPAIGLFFPRLVVNDSTFVFWQLRVPRVIAGLMVGGSLGLAGAVTQALFRNHLATPSTTGTLAGATLGALVAIVLGASPNVGLAGLPAVTLCAFIGALIASGVVLAAAITQRLRTSDILLIGIAVTLAATSGSTVIEDLADSPALVAASRWSLGHLGQVGFSKVKLAIPVLAVCWGVLLLQARPLQLIVLGEDLAHSRGVAVKRTRALCMGACALSIAAVVAWCGPIAFVGLIVPAIVRLAVGANQRLVLPGSFLTGAAMLTLCDALGRLILRNHELPVGVVTAALGAPSLILLIVMRRNS